MLARERAPQQALELAGVAGHQGQLDRLGPGTALSDQLRGRVQELSTIASEAQTTMNTLFNEASTKIAELTKKAA